MTHFLEDLAVGQRFTTPSRVITEEDLAAFAAVSGDFNPIHTDPEFASTSIYGQRVAHGLLGLSAATGLIFDAGIFLESTVAMLGIDNWRFRAPIFVGDSIHLELTITGVRATSTPGRGVVERHFRVLNSNDEVVQEGDIALMVRSRPVA